MAQQVNIGETGGQQMQRHTYGMSLMTLTPMIIGGFLGATGFMFAVKQLVLVRLHFIARGSCLASHVPFACVTLAYACSYRSSLSLTTATPCRLLSLLCREKTAVIKASIPMIR